MVNEAFEMELSKYNLKPGVGELFKAVVLDEYLSSHREDGDERKQIAKEMEEQEEILSSARKKFLKEQIDEADFKATKRECTEILQRLERRLIDLPNRSGEVRSIEGLLDVLIERYSNILQYYKDQDVMVKRQIIGSIYPEKLCFDGTQYRTAYLSEPMSLIC